jgi:uncharacterized membrane protein SpoIIM required for sporulation
MLEDNQNFSPPQRTSRPFTFRDLLVSLVSGNWPKIVIIAFIAELVVLFLVSTIPIPQATVSQISNQNSNLARTSDSLDLIARAIFLFQNNFTIALFEFVPFLGWFFFGYSMYNTALAIEVIGINANLPGPLITLSLLFEPHSWLELPAYAIAVTQSFFLISTIGRRSKFKFELARTGLVVVVVASELLIAALFESAEISMQSNLAADFVVPWVAFAVLVVLIIIGRKKLLKGYRPPSSPFDFQQSPITPVPPSPMSQFGQSPLSPPPSMFPRNLARYCGKCGAPIHNPQGAIFCDQCGQRIIQPNISNTSASSFPANPPPSPSELIRKPFSSG